MLQRWRLETTGHLALVAVMSPFLPTLPEIERNQAFCIYVHQCKYCKYMFDRDHPVRFMYRAQVFPATEDAKPKLSCPDASSLIVDASQAFPMHSIAE